MRLDFIAHPELAERWLVVEATTGEPIEHIAWVDTDADTYATIKLRPRTMSDPPGVDLRLRDQNGAFILAEHLGMVELVDRHISPFKSELMALLDDPDVRMKIRAIAKNRGWFLRRFCGKQ